MAAPEEEAATAAESEGGGEGGDEEALRRLEVRESSVGLGREPPAGFWGSLKDWSPQS